MSFHWSSICDADVQWFQLSLYQLCDEFQGIVFESSSSSRNFLKLFNVFCEVLVLSGELKSHWVVKSCTTKAKRCCNRDSPSSLMILWSAITKSPKFVARGRWPSSFSVFLLQRGQVIFVCLQISQFGSFRKWVNRFCVTPVLLEGRDLRREVFLKDVLVHFQMTLYFCPPSLV